MIAGGIFAALISFALCAALTPVVRVLCLRWGAVDQPGPLKIHSRPVPRLGGISIALSLSAAILVASPRLGCKALFFFAALAAIWLIGLSDDLHSLSPIVRLAAQIVPGILLWLGGWRFSVAVLRPGSNFVGLISVCALILLFANSWNFFDGSDGLAAGVAAIIGGSYVAITRGSLHNPFSVILACSIAGSCSAFLLFNFPVANIFLGDSGSTLLGFCIAFLALEPPRGNGLRASAALLPILLAGLPVIDAALAIVRRLKRRSSPLRGDRGHIYDRMLARGWPARRVAVACYGITGALAFLGWLGMQFGLRCFETISVASLAGLVILEIRFGALRSQENGGQREKPAYSAAHHRSAQEL